MYYLQCICGKSHPLTDVLQCPFCHKLLLDMTDEYARKHIDRCRDYRKSLVKGNRKTDLTEEVEDVPIFRKKCSNCGVLHCAGKDDTEECDRWQPRDLDDCPHCHRKPQVRFENGVLVEIRCDFCRTVMTPYNMRDGSNLMREIWNSR